MSKTVTVVNNKIVVTETQPDIVTESSIDILLKKKADAVAEKNNFAAMVQKANDEKQKVIDGLDAQITDALAKGAMTDADYKASQVV